MDKEFEELIRKKLESEPTAQVAGIGEFDPTVQWEEDGEDGNEELSSKDFNEETEKTFQEEQPKEEMPIANLDSAIKDHQKELQEKIAAQKRFRVDKNLAHQQRHTSERSSVFRASQARATDKVFIVNAA